MFRAFVVVVFLSNYARAAWPYYAEDLMPDYGLAAAGQSRLFRDLCTAAPTTSNTFGHKWCSYSLGPPGSTQCTNAKPCSNDTIWAYRLSSTSGWNTGIRCTNQNCQNSKLQYFKLVGNPSDSASFATMDLICLDSQSCLGMTMATDESPPFQIVTGSSETTVWCVGSQSCQNAVLSCPTSYDPDTLSSTCRFSCQGDNACNGATFDCGAFSSTCEVGCVGSGCNQLTITAGASVTTLTVACDACTTVAPNITSVANADVTGFSGGSSPPATTPPSRSPTGNPVTPQPSTSQPSSTPATSSPTTSSPSTNAPSASPSKTPATVAPSDSPSSTPTTANPTTSMPSAGPSSQPSNSPSSSQPSKGPSSGPSSTPTSQPSSSPSTMGPTGSPIPGTTPPTSTPSSQPSTGPVTLDPSAGPSSSPSSSPSKTPATGAPTTGAPSTQVPSASPGTSMPTGTPSTGPVLGTSTPTTGSPTGSPTITTTSSPIKSQTSAPSPQTSTVVPDPTPHATAVPQIDTTLTTYANEGKTINVVFDTPTNLGSQGFDPFDCQPFIQVNGAHTATDVGLAMCQWQTREKLVMTLGPNAVVGIYSFTMQSIRSQDLQFGQSGVQFSPVVPVNLVPDPVASISGPAAIGYCGDFVFDAGSSQHSTGTPHWRVQMGLNVVEVDHDTYTLNSDSLPATVSSVIITLTVSNSKTSAQTILTVSRQANSPPALTLSGMAYRNVSNTYEDQRVTVVATPSCVNTAVEYRWRLISSTPPHDITSVLTANGPNLDIAGGTLNHRGEYVFEALANPTGQPNLNSSVRVTVKGFNTPIVAAVSQRSVSSQATSSVDPNALFSWPGGQVATGYTSWWNCKRADFSRAQQQENIQTKLSLVETLPLNGCPSLILPVNDNNPVVFASGDLMPGSAYRFTLFYSDTIPNAPNERTFESRTTLFVLSLPLPQIELFPQPNRFNPQSRVVLKAQVSGATGVAVADIRADWYPTDTSLLPNDLLMPFLRKEVSVLSDTLMELRLVLNPNFQLNSINDPSRRCYQSPTKDGSSTFFNGLLAGVKYSFTIRARNAADPPEAESNWASATVDLQANSAPAGGNCTVSPAVGTSLSDFTFSCVNWRDVEGDQFNYQFALYPNGDRQQVVYLTQDFRVLSSLTQTLGQGNHVAVAVIRDTEGLAVCQDIPVTVTELTATTNSSVETIIEDKIRTDLEELFSTNNMEQAITLSIALAQSINESSASAAVIRDTLILGLVNNTQQNVQSMQAVVVLLSNDSNVNSQTSFAALVWSGNAVNGSFTLITDPELVAQVTGAVLDVASASATVTVTDNSTTQQNEFTETLIDVITNAMTLGIEGASVGEESNYTSTAVNTTAKLADNGTDPCPGTLVAVYVPPANLNGIGETVCVISIVKSNPADNKTTPVSPTVTIDVLGNGGSGAFNTRLFDGANASHWTWACTPLQFDVPLSNDTALPDGVVPVCQYWNPVTQSYSTDGCHVVSHTDSKTTCACRHLTSFAVSLDTFVPRINIIRVDHFRDFTVTNVFFKYPVAFYVTLGVYILSLLLVLLMPKRDDTPFLARYSMFDMDVEQRQVALSKTYFGREVGTLGNVTTSFWRKTAMITGVRMFDDHSVLSLFNRSEGTNYSKFERVAVLQLYLLVTMAASAMFYGWAGQRGIGDMVLALYVSILSTGPAWALKYMFMYSRPRNKQSFKNLESRLLTKNVMKQIALGESHGSVAPGTTPSYHHRTSSVGTPGAVVVDDDDVDESISADMIVSDLRHEFSNSRHNTISDVVISVESPERGFELAPDENQFNVHVKRISKTELSRTGLKTDMLLRKIGSDDVLGLTYDEVVKVLRSHNYYPIQFTFCDNFSNRVNFKTVIFGSSIYQAAVEKEAPQAQIVEYLAVQGLSQPEIRAAVLLSQKNPDIVRHARNRSSLIVGASHARKTTAPSAIIPEDISVDDSVRESDFLGLNEFEYATPAGPTPGRTAGGSTARPEPTPGGMHAPPPGTDYFRGLKASSVSPQAVDDFSPRQSRQSIASMSLDEEHIEALVQSQASKRSHLLGNVHYRKRKELLRTEHPLPAWVRHCGWACWIVLSLVATFLIVFYGVQFDIQSSFAVNEEMKPQSNCTWPNTVDVNETMYSQYLANQEALANGLVLPHKYTNKGAASFGSDIEDSQKFMGAIGLAFIQSLLVWQPLFIFIFAMMTVVNWEKRRGYFVEWYFYPISFAESLCCVPCIVSYNCCSKGSCSLTTAAAVVPKEIDFGGYNMDGVVEHSVVSSTEHSSLFDSYKSARRQDKRGGHAALLLDFVLDEIDMCYDQGILEEVAQEIRLVRQNSFGDLNDAPGTVHHF